MRCSYGAFFCCFVLKPVLRHGADRDRFGMGVRRKVGWLGMGSGVLCWVVGPGWGWGWRWRWAGRRLRGGDAEQGRLTRIDGLCDVQDDDYVVPEHLRINADKKRRQMILLEESVYTIRMGCPIFLFFILFSCVFVLFSKKKKKKKRCPQLHTDFESVCGCGCRAGSTTGCWRCAT